MIFRIHRSLEFFFQLANFEFLKFYDEINKTISRTEKKSHQKPDTFCLGLACRRSDWNKIKKWEAKTRGTGSAEQEKRAKTHPRKTARPWTLDPFLGFDSFQFSNIRILLNLPESAENIRSQDMKFRILGYKIFINSCRGHFIKFIFDFIA